MGTESSSTQVAPKISRRRVVAGAAWSVPAVMVAGAAPAVAASPCEVQFETTQESRKCCNGPVKNMKVVLRATDINNCVGNTQQICVTDVKLANNQPIGSVVTTGACGLEGDDLTVYLLNTQSCTVNLLVFYSIDGVPVAQPAAVKSDNISSGNTDGACCPDGICP